MYIKKRTKSDKILPLTKKNNIKIKIKIEFDTIKEQIKDF